MPGREPERRNRYYSPKVTWLLVVLVGIAILVVGLTIFTESNYLSHELVPLSDSLEIAAAESLNTPPQSEAIPNLSEKKDLTKEYKKHILK